MRTATCLQPKVHYLAAFGFAVLTLALLVGHVRSSHAQESGGVVPASNQSGSFFNQNLGTALRFNYHTQGYGTQEDVFSLGGMKVFNMDDATVFVDGQGTLSDDFGGGFNLGVGYRQLTTTGMSFDPQRILGVGFWTDGQSTASDNFFTQLGFSLESLGDSFDLRLNGHFPLERTQTSDPILTDVGSAFMGNSLFGSTEELTIDTAHSVVDGEFAKRIKNLEAWAFVGGYHLGGGGVDATGYRVGVRGYAVPDLALSLQVTEDDIYDANLMFGVTWFIGRTNKCNGPCGTLLDRFREPVLRNDFIALSSRRVSQAAGDALTLDGTNLVDIVHVDSSAAAGGDGTFENPFDELVDIDAVLNLANTRDGSIVLVHGGSMLDGSATLRQDVRLLGEGVDQDGSSVSHTVVTDGGVNVVLPETMAGALAMDRPEIDGTGVAVVLTMADGTAIDNFTINNAATAISVNGITVPTGDTIANVLIQDPTVTGISLTNVMGSAVLNSNVIINGASGIGLLVDGGDESVSMFGAINDSTGNSLIVRNRTGGGTVLYAGTIDDDTDDSGDFSLGVLITGNTDANISFNNASVLGIHVTDGGTGFNVLNNTNTDVSVTGIADVDATGTGRALAISGNDDTSDITFADLNATAINGNTVSVADAGTVTISSATGTPARGIFNTGTGNAFFNDGAANSAIITVNSNVENTGGGTAVNIINRAEANDIQFAGTVEAMGAAGVFAQNNTDGTILFSNTLTLDTAGNNAVELVGNIGATLSFADLDIDTTDGSGFIATGGGTLLVTSTNGTNDINVTGNGVGVNLTGMTIDSANVVFDVVGVGNGAGVGINLEDLDGAGQVAIGGGTNAGDGGSLTTAGTGIIVDNANNVLLTNMTISNGGAAQGVSVTGQLAGSTATFAGLESNAVNADAVNVSGNTDGTIIFTDLTAMTTLGSGGAVVINSNAAATVTINGLTATATGTGLGFSATGTGNLAVTGATSVSTNTGRVLEIDGQEIDAAGAKFDTVNATSTVAGSAVVLSDVTGGLVTVGSGTNAGDGGTIQTSGAAAAILVDNVVSLAMNNVTIDNDTTTGGGLDVINNAGGTRTFSGMVVSTKDEEAVNFNTNSGGTTTFNTLTADTTAGNEDAVIVQNNTGGTVTVNTATIDTAAGIGVRVADNGNANVNLNSLSINTTGGTGMRVTGAGNVTTGGTSTIDSMGGTGIDILNAENALINNVTINVDSTNAVFVHHNDGNASNVSLNNITTTTTTAGNGVRILSDGTAEFDLSITGADITTSDAGVIGILYDLGVNHIGRSDFTLTGSTVNAANSNAVRALLDDGTGDVRFLLENNTNLAGNVGAGESAVDIDVSTNIVFNATIGNTETSDILDPEAPPESIGDFNLFTNSGAGATFRLVEADAGATVNLDLRDNTAAGGTGFSLSQSLGTFNLVDGADTIAGQNNVGIVTDAGAITPIAPPVASPTP